MIYFVCGFVCEPNCRTSERNEGKKINQQSFRFVAGHLSVDMPYSMERGEEQENVSLHDTKHIIDRFQLIINRKHFQIEISQKVLEIFSFMCTNSS